MRVTGVFDKFWFWTFSYGREYATRIPISEAMRSLWSDAPVAIASNWPVWGMAGVGLVLLFIDKKARANWFFAVSFLLLSFLAVCPGFYFRNHYFVLMLPAVSLLAGIAVSSGSRLLARLGALRFATVALLALALWYPVSQYSDFFFKLSPTEACRQMYGLNPFPESIQIADYIKSHTNKNDRIAVIGSEPQIYFYADRLSATGYIYTYGLMEDQKYALTMQREMIHEIESTKPKYMVIVGISVSWLKNPNSKTLIFDWFSRYTQEYYQAGRAHRYCEHGLDGLLLGSRRAGKIAELELFPLRVRKKALIAEPVCEAR